MEILKANYNQSKESLKISEYGRNIQLFVELIKKEDEINKRTEMAESLVEILLILNPSLKSMEDGRQKLWDHIFLMADYDLNIISPYPMPDKGILAKKPEPIPYPESLIQYRFYGRNLQLMVQKAIEMEEGEMKIEFLNMIASFMSNSSRNWNDEELTTYVLVEHMKVLSSGKLIVNPDDLIITFEPKRRFNKKPNHNRRNNGKNRHKGNNKKRY